MDRRSVWRDQSHDLKIETAFGRSFLFVRVCSRLSPDHLKHNQAGIAPGPTYTARGLHPTVLPSWFHIVTARHPLARSATIDAASAAVRSAQSRQTSASQLPPSLPLINMADYRSRRYRLLSASRTLVGHRGVSQVCQRTNPLSREGAGRAGGCIGSTVVTI